MADRDDGTDQRQASQTRLEAQFGRQIDPILIAALVHEPGQTYETAHAILSGLTGDAVEIESAQDGEGHGEGIASDAESLERTLEEWKLMDRECGDPENLRMTDEEDDAEGLMNDKEYREAIRLGDATGKGTLAIQEIAAGERGVSDDVNVGPDELSGPQGGIAFLTHAFPTRTPAFLHDVLADEQGDVSRAVDTLMTLELVESGALDDDNDDDHEAYGSVKEPYTFDGRRMKMADDEEHLMNGTGWKKSTKRDRQKRKAEKAQAGGLSGLTSSTPQKVNLTDVRQGGPARIVVGKRLHAEVGSSSAHTPIAENDETLAARLAREERMAAGLKPEEEEDDGDVRDNDWLFSSSVLEQLSILLDMPSHKVRSVHAAGHMNLRATLYRLIYTQCQEYPSLQALDQQTEQAEGTSQSLLDGLCALMPNKSQTEVERYLRATGGRQDAVLDLAQLADRIEATAVGERTDVLDPMKMDRTASQVHAPTVTTFAGQSDGHFAFVGDGRLGHGTASPSPYSSAAGRSKASQDAQTASRQHALQRLRAGASSVTFPFNSAHIQGPMATGSSGSSGIHAETATEAARLAQEYTTIAQEYRTRRQDYLAKAARSYRSTHNAAVDRGPMRGAAAWVYAEEARRLDAKARAFALQAAQATVRYRMLSNRTALPAALTSARSSHAAWSGYEGAGARQGDVVDLHGLTVHESLTITRQALQAWWAQAASRVGRPPPLHVITGVGRHSRGQVALVRPAVLAMLQREQWSCREPQQGHILVLGKR